MTTATMQKVIISADSMAEMMAAILHKDADPNKPKIGAPFVTLITKTTPALVAANPFGGNIRKVAKVQVQLGVAYENAVNNQRNREGNSAEFKSDNRKWGKRVSGTPFVVHTPKGKAQPKLYIDCKVHRSVEYHYETPSGIDIDKASVTPWLRPRSASRQGVKREVYWRCYGIDKVIGFIFGGTLYAIEDNMTLLTDLLAVRAS